jgi:pimeloyl-ACP methyl ester carboxylesterase
VAGVLDQRFGEPVLLVGIGFGGNVGAELALTYPGTVSGVVMVDTDLFSRPTLDEWSPYCEQGGWCPTPDELGRRAFIVTIEDTTETLYRFRRTNEAALAPSNLADISVPMAYVWSLDGPIERSTIDRLSEGLPGIEVVDSSTFQAHLEDHDAVNSAIVALSG